MKHMKLIYGGGISMIDIANKFPKIYNCSYKKDIDNDLKNHKSPYSISKWLDDVGEPISDSTIRRYQKCLIEIGEITAEDKKRPKPSLNKEKAFEQLEDKLFIALDKIELAKASNNVLVQFILGAYKLLYGEKYSIEIEDEREQENIKRITDVFKQ